MTGEADDLMLSLMQIADEAPAPDVPSKGVNPLQKIKPYPSHKGDCGGMVAAQPGKDEEGNFCMLFRCMKCGQEEIVEMEVKGDEGFLKAPSWVDPPNV